MDINNILDQIYIFAFTFVSNLFAAVSGGGAGLVQFPFLILMGLPFPVALGTHKLAVVFSGVATLVRKRKEHSNYSIDKAAACAMIFAGCPAVILGTLIAVIAPSHIAETAVGLVTIAMGCYSFSQKDLGKRSLTYRSPLRLTIGYLLIFVLGVFSGSLSSGTGLFVTMVFILVFGLELKRAILHTMIFVSMLWCAVGAFTVGALTSIYWQWLPTMIIAAFSGAYLGTTLLFKIPRNKIRLIFSIVAILSGVLLIYTAFQN